MLAFLHPNGLNGLIRQRHQSEVQVLLLSNLPRTASVVWYTTLRESAVARLGPEWMGHGQWI